MQFSCQSSFIPSCSDPTNLQSRSDRDGGRASSGIQLRNKNITYPKHSESAIAVVLEEVERKQTEMLTWPLTDLRDAGRFHIALSQIQSVLITVLTKQHLEKNNLAPKYWCASYSLQQRLLKSQLISLASYQRKLMEILHKQMYLVTNYVIMKGKYQAQSSIYQQGNMREHQRPYLCSLLAPIPKSSKQREACSCEQDSKHREISGTQVSVSSSPSGGDTQGMKDPLYTVNDNEKICQDFPKQETYNTLQHINIKMEGKKALPKSKTEDNTTNLNRLILVIPPSSTLQLFLKGLYRDKSLSYYVLNIDAKGSTLETHLMDDQRNKTSSAQEMLTETTSLNHQMKINIIHLVDDAELLPNAIMDCYWGKILKKNYLQSADWVDDLF